MQRPPRWRAARARRRTSRRSGATGNRAGSETSLHVRRVRRSRSRLLRDGLELFEQRHRIRNDLDAVGAIPRKRHGHPRRPDLVSADGHGGDRRERRATETRWRTVGPAGSGAQDSSPARCIDPRGGVGQLEGQRGPEAVPLVIGRARGGDHVHGLDQPGCPSPEAAAGRGPPCPTGPTPSSRVALVDPDDEHVRRSADLDR